MVEKAAHLFDINNTGVETDDNNDESRSTDNDSVDENDKLNEYPSYPHTVGSSKVPFLMCTLEIPQKIAAQVLALNFLLSLLLSFFLKL